tara:strand:- start:7563 stop:8255 length:693 start_codon:yes stop_codon:yes gene_type:complete
MTDLSQIIEEYNQELDEESLAYNIPSSYFKAEREIGSLSDEQVFNLPIEQKDISFMDPGFGGGFDEEITKELAKEAESLYDPNIFQEIIGGFETLGEKGRSFLADLFGTDPEKVGQFFKSLQGVMGYAGSKGGSSSARQLVRSAKTTAPTPRASGFRSTPVRRATPAQKAASNTASLIRQAQQNGTSTARIQNAKLANLLRNVVQVSETKPRTERLSLPQQSISIRRRTA